MSRSVTHGRLERSGKEMKHDCDATYSTTSSNGISIGKGMSRILYQRSRVYADRTVRCYLSLDCNANCSYCSAGIPSLTKERKAVSIDPEIWAEGINRRGRSTILAGGEPFLYRGFNDLVSMLKIPRVEIYTNLLIDVEGFLKATMLKSTITLVLMVIFSR